MPTAATTRPVVHALTSLRFVAALAVFGFHAAVFFAHSGIRPVVGDVAGAGPTGVSFFFVLSGFVLTWSRRDGDRRRDFYRRRLARVYPLHVLTWTGAGLVLIALGLRVSHAGAGLSAVLLQAWVPRRAVYDAMNTPSWSLSCEAFFYALFPLLLVALLRAPARRRHALVAAMVAAALAVTLAGPAVDHALGAPGYFPEFCPVARLPEFVLGMLLALEVEAGSWPTVPLPAAVVAAVGAYLATGALATPRARIIVTLLPYLLLVGAAAQAETRGDRSARPLRRAWPVRLGQWSFALYLVHGPVLLVALHLEGERPLGSAAAAGWVLLTFVVSLALSGLLFTLVERPLERRLRPDHHVAAALAPVVATAPLRPAAVADSGMT